MSTTTTDLWKHYRKHAKTAQNLPTTTKSFAQPPKTAQNLLTITKKSAQPKTLLLTATTPAFFITSKESADNHQTTETAATHKRITENVEQPSPATHKKLPKNLQP
jgi:hypothetical protein